jgi:CHASE2 domain-containing sensor protein
MITKIKTSFLATVFCLAILAIAGKLLGSLLHKVEILNPMRNKIEDYEMSDLIFAYVHKSANPDTNIVIVNCYNDDRNNIASKIEKLESFSPKVIGIDIIFGKALEDTQNIRLIRVLNRYKDNIVLAALHGTEEESRTMNLPFYQDMQFQNEGSGSYHIGFLKQESLLKTKRHFEPFIKTEGEKPDTSFAVKVISLSYGRKQLKTLGAAAGESKLVNLRKGVSNLPRYLVFDTIPNNPDIFRNKIVLLGGFNEWSLEDKHFTPLNLYIGRSLPDMNGIEYLSQIISMIITNDYMKPLPYNIFWIFMSCFLFMFLLIRIHQSHNYYHLLLDFILLVFLAPLSMIICALLMENFRIKLEPTEFIIPIFFSGLLLPSYEPFTNWLSRIIKRKPKSTDHE